MIAPYRPFRSGIRPDYDQVIIAVSRHRLEAIAAQLHGVDESGGVELPLASFDIPPGVASLLEALVQMATDDSGSTTPALLAKMDDLVVEALLLAIPSFRYQLPGPTRVHSRRLGEAMTYMEAHLTEPLTLSEIARHVGVTPRSLQLAFRQELQETPMRWLRARRLEHARALLLRDGSPASVAEAAHASGFHHLGDFASAFRARFGELPSATRRRAAGETADVRRR